MQQERNYFGNFGRVSPDKHCCEVFVKTGYAIFETAFKELVLHISGVLDQRLQQTFLKLTSYLNMENGEMVSLPLQQETI